MVINITVTAFSAWGSWSTERLSSVFKISSMYSVRIMPLASTVVENNGESISKLFVFNIELFNIKFMFIQ